MIENLADLGDIFRQFRDHKGLSQERLAELAGAGVNRTQVAHLEQGRRLPKPEGLRKIAHIIDIPEPVWAPFAKEASHQRQEFESILSELVGEPVGLRSMDLQSVRAAEDLVSALFSGSLTPRQGHDTLNSVLVFYGISTMSWAFYNRYVKPTAFQSIATFEEATRSFQIEAIRLYSTFAEAYLRMNGVANLDELLRALQRRGLESYTERTNWKRIVSLPDDKLEFLGYISVEKYKQQRRKREALAKYLRELASEIRNRGAHALDEMTEKRRRKMDSLMQELRSSLIHTPMSTLFAPNPGELEAEAQRILRDEKDEEEMGRTQKQALANLSHYIASDHMDVYVATSMRTTSDFIAVNRFAGRLFEHEKIAPLRLRYFNPTQSWIEDRVAKGLVEALMLRRASVTLYMAQKSDSFGKDSEASVALGQGKPVIVYVPKLYIPSANFDSEKLAAMEENALRELLLKRGNSGDDLDELDKNGLFAQTVRVRLEELNDEQLIEAVELHWADFALLDEHERIKGKGETRVREEYTSLVRRVMRGETPALTPEVRPELIKILVAVTVNFEQKRAHVFKEVHPLALQLILSTGVLNGILVARSIDSCAHLLRGLLENNLELELKPEPENYRLIEKTTGSTIRVISRNSLLSHALNRLYDRL